MPDLDEILKECCKVCGTYRCQNHLDWLRCGADDCSTTWDATVFFGCPTCLKMEQKPVYRPRLKERCCLCKTALNDGSTAYTDATPAGTFCELCAIVHKIAFWTINVRSGRLWTVEEIAAERKRAG